MMTSGIARMIWPIRSDTMSSGRKAAMVVSVAAMTGASMRRAPRSAAPTAPAPAARCVTACSPTTMASSTMMPTAMMSPNRLTMLMDWPASIMTPMVASSETGIPTVTQKATRALRKTKRTMTTSASPLSPLRSSMLMRSSMSSAASS